MLSYFLKDCFTIYKTPEKPCFFEKSIVKATEILYKYSKEVSVTIPVILVPRPCGILTNTITPFDPAIYPVSTFWCI